MSILHTIPSYKCVQCSQKYSKSNDSQLLIHNHTKHKQLTNQVEYWDISGGILGYIW